MSNLASTKALSPTPTALPRRLLATAALYFELAKGRLSALVLMTTLVGYLLYPAHVDWARLLATLAGTWLAACGANALNQYLEREADGRMRRTRGRPLPAGRLSPAAALSFGLVCGLGGPLLLAWLANVLAASLALGTLLLYVAVYTPLKVRSPLNTLVGAVVGALPPMIGWAAAGGRLDAGAWGLAAILFAWQMPHFLALAWLLREEYARGGFRMLPAVDPSGSLTSCVAVSYALALAPLGWLLTWLGTCGWVYGAGALLLAAALTWAAVCLERRRSDEAARRLFLASLVYLPLLLALMVVDRGTGLLR